MSDLQSIQDADAERTKRRAIRKEINKRMRDTHKKDAMPPSEEELLQWYEKAKEKSTLTFSSSLCQKILIQPTLKLNLDFCFKKVLLKKMRLQKIKTGPIFFGRHFEIQEAITKNKMALTG